MSTFWLSGGLYFCDEHKTIACIPFFSAPEEAVCNVCSDDAPESHLSFVKAEPDQFRDLTKMHMTVSDKEVTEGEMGEKDRWEVRIRCCCGFWREWSHNQKSDVEAVRDEWATDHARCGGYSLEVFQLPSEVDR